MRLPYIMRVSNFTVLLFVFCYFLQFLLNKMFILRPTLNMRSRLFAQR